MKSHLISHAAAIGPTEKITKSQKTALAFQSSTTLSCQLRKIMFKLN